MEGVMKSILYTEPGAPSVLRLVERPVQSPDPGEVRVKVTVSGVNPTDIKARQSFAAPPPRSGQVPHQDGAGIVDATGDGVTAVRAGDRVWMWDAAWRRTEGTAQQFVVLPEHQVVALPDQASFDVGASLGIPALTAHRALTAHPGAPVQLEPGALNGLSVLVAGGAGVVGHAAIQLAEWAGATVLTTVSSPAKAALAARAGAHHVIDYHECDVAQAVAQTCPGGVDIVVEVNLRANAHLDVTVLADNGVIAVYAGDDGDAVALPTLASMFKNVRVQYVFTYLTEPARKLASVRAVSAAVAAGAMNVGEDNGLPLQHFPLERTADAHRVSEEGFVGKVLVTVTH
jgi:NADPH2:quinone reductase